MIERMASYFAKLIYSDNKETNAESEENELEVIQYGIECIINLLVPIIIIFFYSILAHRIPDMIIWLISFLTLRNYLGGYHASSHLRCMILSSITGILALLFSSIMTSTYLCAKVISLSICMILFLIHGPILQDQTYKTIRNSLYIKGIVIFIVDIIFVFILLYFNCKLGNALFIGVCTAFILYLLELLKKKKDG
ncbi:MAG: accessory gene regulator B family protein [Wujia sp.]